jgi:hypothetical protein
MRNSIKIASFLLAALPVCAHAQWLNYKDPRTPRTKDGKPNLSAPPPKDSKGKPDLSGIWLTDSTPRAEMDRLFGAFGLGTFIVPGDDPLAFNKYVLNILADFKPGEEPLRPEAVPLFRKNSAPQNAANTPSARCLPQGIPWSDGGPQPYKIIQTPELTLVIYEADPTRQIYTDGRPHTADADPSWMGYPTGKWEGDTFVVDSVGFNDRTWLDAFGHPHSEALHVVERFRRRDFGHMDLEVTFEDSQMYTRPVTLKYTQTLLPDTDMLNYICQEDEKDRAHIPN